MPKISGDKIKSYHLLKHLGRSHDVTLVCLSHRAAPEQQDIATMEAMGIRVHPVVLSPVKGGLRSLLKIATPSPLEVDFYNEPKMHEVVSNLVKTNEYDVVISFFMRTAEYIKDLPIPKILVAEDCRILYQSRSAAVSTNPLQRMVREWEVRKLKRYEPAMVQKFDLTTFVTETDIETIKRYAPEGKYALLTNGADLEEFTYDENEDRSERRGVAFWGKLNVWSNQMSTTELLRDIYPIITKSLPDEPCMIAGSYAPAALQNYMSAGVELVENPPEMGPVIRRAAVMVNPHRGASGIQNKVLQAMASGCAVVTTPTGIQGIRARHGVHALIGETPEELAAHCITLLRTPTLCAAIAKNARRLIERDHTWDAIGKQMDAALAAVLGWPAAEEQQEEKVRPVLKNTKRVALKEVAN